MEKTPSRFARFAGNPIIRPDDGQPWDNYQAFNPAAILLENRVHLIYRAIGDDRISRFGYASSEDGCTVTERLTNPVYRHPVTSSHPFPAACSSGGGFGGAEDPRLVRVGDDDILYMTYTACDDGIRMAITSIAVDDFLRKDWKWKQPAIISPPGQIHKNWVIFPEKIGGKYAVLHSLNPRVMISYHESFDVKPGDYLNSYDSTFSVQRNSSWDTVVRGAGAPPVKTEKGWLLFYHAMNGHDYGQYKVGAMLLDLQNPEKVIARSPFPVLEPQAVYEKSGFKPGVVYLTGAVVRDGRLLVYYGASDSYVCTAECRLDEITDTLVREKPGRTQVQVLKKAGWRISRRGGKDVNQTIRRQPDIKAKE
jgi:predicted GH43/DUF377 family glycosyl hydrolase